MKPSTALLLAFLTASVTHADGVKDNQIENVRRVPPPGIAVPDKDRTELNQELAALAKEPGRVFTRDALLSEVWGYQHSSDTRLVNVHVQRLRSKIEIDPDNPQIVLTVRGVGYRAGTPSK